MHRSKEQRIITLLIKLARFVRKSACLEYGEKACISFLPSISNLMVANSKPGLTKAKNILVFKNAILYSQEIIWQWLRKRFAFWKPALFKGLALVFHPLDRWVLGRFPLLLGLRHLGFCPTQVDPFSPTQFRRWAWQGTPLQQPPPPLGYFLPSRPSWPGATNSWGGSAPWTHSSPLQCWRITSDHRSKLLKLCRKARIFV